MYAGEPGGYAGEPGGYAGEPGGYAGEPGGYAGEPGGYAGEPGGYAGEPIGVVEGVVDSDIGVSECLFSLRAVAKLLRVIEITSVGEISGLNNNLSMFLENDMFSNCSILSSVIKRICTFIVCNSCINNFNVYGTFTTLKLRPYLLICSTCSVPSNEPVNLSGPSAIGLSNILFDSL